MSPKICKGENSIIKLDKLLIFAEVAKLPKRCSNINIIIDPKLISTIYQLLALLRHGTERKRSE